MTQLLIVAHAPLASALKEVAVHAFPDCAGRLQALDVEPDDSPAEVESRLRALLGSDEVLILVDAFGATPCNGALRVADGVRVKVVAGVNVPMLWRSVCYASEPLSSLAALASSGAVQGVMQLGASRPQNQVATPPRSDDLVHGHHHQ